jgi:hypothetical protein
MAPSLTEAAVMVLEAAEYGLANPIEINLGILDEEPTGFDWLEEGLMEYHYETVLNKHFVHIDEVDVEVDEEGTILSWE